MRAGSSRRDFIRRTLLGGAIAGLISRAASPSAKAESRPVDRRKLGRTGAEVSILALGLGAAFMERIVGLLTKATTFPFLLNHARVQSRNGSPAFRAGF